MRLHAAPEFVAANTGTLTTFPPLRTRRAKPAPFSVAMTRDTALFDRYFIGVTPDLEVTVRLDDVLAEIDGPAVASVAKLHPKLGEPRTLHAATIEEPPIDAAGGPQLTLT